MRYILFILIFLPVALSGQTLKKVQDLDPATSPDADDIMYFEQDGTAKNITRSILLKATIDSMNNIVGIEQLPDLTEAQSVSSDDLFGLNHVGFNRSVTKLVMQSDLNDAIADLESIINILSDNLDDFKTNMLWDSVRLSTSGDTIFSYLGDNVVSTYVQVITPTYTDNISPVMSSASTPTSTTVALNFNEPMNTDTVTTEAAFVLTENAVTFGITSTAISGNTVTLTLDSAILIGSSLLVDYTVPASLLLQDTSYNTAASFTDYIVVNSVATTQTAYAHYPFDYTVDDSIGSNDMTGTNILYSAAVTPKQGAYFSYFSNTTRWGSLDSDFDLDTVWTVLFWFRSTNTTDKTFFTNENSDDGWKLQLKHSDNDKLKLFTGNGTLTDQAESADIGYSTSTWYHCAVVADGDTVTFYINGVDITNDPVIRTDYKTDTCQVGKWGYGYMDDLQWYKFALTQSEVTTVMNNPGSRIQRYGDDEDETDDSEITSVFSTDFEDNTIGAEVDGYPAGYTRVEADSDFGVNASFGPGRYPNPNGDYSYVGSAGITSSYKSSGKSLYVFIKEGVYQVGVAGYTQITKTNELHLEYNVMFKPGWTVLDGGKLWGFAGTGTGIKNTSVPSGASEPYDIHEGFSARMTWSRTSNTKRNGIAIYLYHHDRENLNGNSILAGENNYCATDPVNSQTSGEDVPDFTERLQAWTGTDTVYINIIQRVVMNTVDTEGVGNYDGIIEIFIDGDLHYQRTNLRLRNYSDIGIDRIYLDSYTGGSGEGAKPTRNEWLLFDDPNAYTLDDPPVSGNNASSIGRVMVPQVYPKQ